MNQRAPESIAFIKGRGSEIVGLLLGRVLSTAGFYFNRHDLLKPSSAYKEEAPLRESGFDLCKTLHTRRRLARLILH